MLRQIPPDVGADRNDAPLPITGRVQRRPHQHARPPAVAVLFLDDGVHERDDRSDAAVVALTEAIPENADEFVVDEKIEPAVVDVVLDTNDGSVDRSGTVNPPWKYVTHVTYETSVVHVTRDECIDRRRVESLL